MPRRPVTPVARTPQAASPQRRRPSGPSPEELRRSVQRLRGREVEPAPAAPVQPAAAEAPAAEAAQVSDPWSPAARVRRGSSRPAPAATAPVAQEIQVPTSLDRWRSRRSSGTSTASLHPLTDRRANGLLHDYESEVKGSFDRIVPVLQRLSALQHEDGFVARAKDLAQQELGFALPLPILEKAWVTQLDMRTLFAWCVFQTYELTSARFFELDPLGGKPGSAAAEAFDAFLLECGFHLLDITPCADGRLAHSIAYALRLPFSSVRRRSHAGALFDVENTVNRWVKTEHRRYREGVPNPAHADTRYLKVVLYHFSSLDPAHEGCAAHGSDDALAAGCGLARLKDFQQAVENSFCCGASVDLLLLGIDTDTDALRVHMPGMDGSTRLDRWLDARAVYEATRNLTPEQGRERITAMVQDSAASTPDPGMVRLVSRLLEHNLSQIDYVRQVHGGHYADAGHAERFIGVGIGFKEVHLRNLTYFAYMDTVEEGAADLDVGVKIFKGLNVSRGLPVPVVVRFDYNGKVPGARERAERHCSRVLQAIENRYADLWRDGLLHVLLTVRDQDRHAPAETIGSSITFASAGGH